MTECKTCGGTGVFHSSDDMGHDEGTCGVCPDCATVSIPLFDDGNGGIQIGYTPPPTDYDKAVEAAWDTYLEFCGFYPDSIDFLKHEFDRVVHLHLDPVVQGMRNQIAIYNLCHTIYVADMTSYKRFFSDQQGRRRTAEYYQEKAETDLAELKKLVREYLEHHPDDHNRWGSAECYYCRMDIVQGEDICRCQNPECVAVRFREECVE